MPSTNDFLSALREQTRLFRAAIVGTGPGDPVPTCPDWNADDLLWHLASVQQFWRLIAAGARPEQLDEPVRPQGRAALLEFFDEHAAALPTELKALDPTTPLWMWTQDEALHRADYLCRRQAHEALIHRVDAELTAGLPVTPLDPTLAADGADEVLRVMYGREHRSLTFTAEPGAIVRIDASDTSRSWLLQLGRERGEVEGHGSVDDANFHVVAAGTPLATVTGTATDLDLWLWNRPSSMPLQLDGRTDLIGRLQAVLDDGLQ